MSEKKPKTPPLGAPPAAPVNTRPKQALSLFPLTTEEALRAALQITPEEFAKQERKERKS